MFGRKFSQTVFSTVSQKRTFIVPTKKCLKADEGGGARSILTNAFLFVFHFFLWGGVGAGDPPYNVPFLLQPSG